MAAGYSPRSVADATRFTSNTPHAHAKAPSASPSPTSSSSSSSVQSSGLRSPQIRTAATPSSTTETIEERVRRLRAAHLAARRHETSRFDRVVNASRRYFDAAHKFTVVGLIGFSGLAVFVTIFASADMMMYNQKRRREFFAVRDQFAVDSLEAARLAYMTGSATEDQIALVEKAEAKARQTGVHLPPLLSAPKPMGPAAANQEEERSAWPGESLSEASLSGSDEVEQPKRKGFAAWLFGGLKNEEPGAGGGEGALNFEQEAAAASSRSGAAEPQHTFKDQAKVAFEQERENQRQGGPLDQLGLDGKPTSQNSEGVEEELQKGDHCEYENGPEEAFPKDQDGKS
ncbi:hypothetical protein AAE478_008113 [Parahypoxylon ruwenzoriense]